MHVVSAGSALPTVTLLAGPRETFVQLNDSASLSCVYLIGSASPSGQLYFSWNSGGLDVVFKDEPVSQRPELFASLGANMALSALNGTHSLLNYSLLVSSARPELNAAFGCRWISDLPTFAFLNVEGMSCSVLSFSVLFCSALLCPLPHAHANTLTALRCTCTV